VPISPKRELERRQRRWAERAGVAFDSRGFVRDPAANLRTPLSAAARAAFERGSEAEPRATLPARIAALHSSAALVANVFDYWQARDAAPVLAALGRSAEPAALSFEEPIPTGLEGDPPLVDVLVRCASGRLVAIESKFCEWLTRRPPNKAELKPKYFPAERALWRDLGLPRCQELADELRAGARPFKYLHAAQLLKHALGLTLTGAAKSELHYLYYDVPGRVGVLHRGEVARFAALVDARVEFAASTYQALYAGLRTERAADAHYLEYLRARYFADAR
jgi:hypothetical protein